MGTKLGMMTYFESSGNVVPVTVVGFREGNIVTQVKTQATDGYDAVQVGYRRVRDKKLTKPEMGHLNKAGVIPLRHLQEFRLQSVEGFEPNQILAVEEIFKEDDLVDVSGITIGKGFQDVEELQIGLAFSSQDSGKRDSSVLKNVKLTACIRWLLTESRSFVPEGLNMHARSYLLFGGIKRHNFKRGQMTHGSKSHRALGSIGAGTTPGHVYKGKKMPGRMGGTKTKIRKLKIVKIDNDLRVVMIKGALPGKPGNLLRITPAKIVGKNIPKN
ncbi:hypothetical protein RJ641_013242 [Dillenia turbinata]|uniref:Large ribosomal subunit protein uL3c n=1 Tax=Dillenia turbinata TaxID=194707 RepID=A0AAN8W3K9_9MAGN